jgi:hypothetical protein
MIESPLIQELLEQRGKQVGNQVRIQDILRVLTLRFGDLPAGFAEAVGVIPDDSALAELLDFAVVSPDLESFSHRLYAGRCSTRWTGP